MPKGVLVRVQQGKSPGARLNGLDLARSDVQRVEDLCAGHTAIVAAECLEGNTTDPTMP